MEGYVVAPNGTDVDLRNGVRHIAYLENGELLVAFDGERPCAGALLVAAEEQPDHRARIRWTRPGPNTVEAFYLLEPATFQRIGSSSDIEAVTYLASGNVLVMTNGVELAPARWGSKAITWVDTRVPEPVG